MSRIELGSQGVCTAEYVCGVPGMLERGEDDAVQVQLFMKDVSIVRLYIPGAETQDSCESCEYASKTPC